MELLRRLFASKHRPYVPYRNQMETVSTSLSGTRFSIALPPNSIADIDPKNPESQINIHDPDIYQPQREPKWYDVGRHAGTMILQRSFDVRGVFWQQLGLGYVWINIAVNRVDDFLEGMSCLNPRHFEQAILRAVYFNYGPPQQVPEDRGNLAPLNWRPMILNDFEWIYLEAHRDFSNYTPAPDECVHYNCYLFAPLDDKHYLSIYFGCGAYSPLQLGMKKISELMAQIIATIKMDPSPNVKQRKIDIQRRHPNDTISTTRQPENWVYHEWRDGDTSIGEDYEVVTKKGTPPPEFTP